MQRFADGDEGGEADGADVAVLEFGEVHVGHAYLFRQLVEAHLPIGHDPVEPKDDLSHGAPPSEGLVGFPLELYLS